MLFEFPAPPTTEPPFEQTLHGYDGGHKLLASTMELPPATRRQMLLLSDLSGPEMDERFDGYISGYPLSEIRYYALARTWYANEMPRPGCVWTHTLLVPFSELGRKSNVFRWLDLLRRPRQVKTTSKDDSVIMTASTTGYRMPTASSAEAATLLNSVYAYSAQSTIVVGTDPFYLEPLVISLWASQWPRLRRNFTFCTGSLSPRFFGDKPFDLQIAPMMLARTFMREPERYRVINMEMLDALWTPVSGTAWVDAVLRSMSTQTDVFNGAQQFCWRYGSDVRPDRSALIPLVETFLEIQGNALPKSHDAADEQAGAATMVVRFGKLVENLADRFPPAREARLLKAEVLGNQAHGVAWHFAGLSEGKLLEVLATTERYASYESDVLNLRHRACVWAGENPAQAAPLLHTLLRTFISPLGEEISAGILSALTPDAALALAQENPDLLPLFVETYPSLANLPATWGGSESQQKAILDVVRRGKVHEWESIALAALSARAGAVAGEIMQLLGSDGIRVVLDWLDAGNICDLGDLPREWRELIASEPVALLEWVTAHLTARIEVVAHLSTLMNPHSVDTLKLTDTVWHRLSGATQLSILSRQLRISVYTFLLSIALHNKGRCSLNIAVTVFQSVHDATAQNALSHDSWRMIEPHLPYIGGLREWDKCEKLRQALVQSFIRFDWPAVALFSAITEKQTFQRVIDFCTDSSGGRELLKRLQKACDSGNEHIKKFHRELLKPKNLIQRWLE